MIIKENACFVGATCLTQRNKIGDQTISDIDHILFIYQFYWVLCLNY